MRAFLLSLVLLFAAATAPAHAQTALPGLTPGVHYQPIEGGVPYRPQAGVIEVAEIFAYWCPHCANFAPMLENWKKTLPARARVVLVPAVYDESDAFAHAYFAAEASKSLPVLHPRLFAAIHETGTLPRNASESQIRTFVSRVQGVNTANYDKALQDSAAISARLKHARDFAIRSKIEGTPSLIVAGKYLVLGNSYEALLDNASRVVKALATQPAAKPAAPKKTATTSSR